MDDVLSWCFVSRCVRWREEKYHVKFKVGGESVFVASWPITKPATAEANHMQEYNVSQKCGSVNV